MPFTTDDPNVRQEWLTVGPAHQLDGRSPAAPLQTQLLGATLCLWRDPAGQACCRTDDGQLLPVQERYAYLWVCTLPPAARALFAMPEFDEPGRRIVDCGGIGVATSGLRVVENFLDMGHFPYIHTGTLGRVPQTTVAPYRVEVDPLTAGDLGAGLPLSPATGLGVRQRWHRCTVPLPGHAPVMRSAVQVLPEPPGALDVIGLFLQPLDEEHVIAYCLLVYFEDRLDDAEMIRFQHMIFGQDKPILESHRPRRMPVRGPLEAHMRCDLSSVVYRRWLARARHAVRRVR
jgi:phenylpropionate dioxygenase-like ring-hydroxylating dioxygenase large terminal subunit